MAALSSKNGKSELMLYKIWTFTMMGGYMNNFSLFDYLMYTQHTT